LTVAKAEFMGAVVDGRYHASGTWLGLGVDLFVELDDGRRVKARNVGRGMGLLRAQVFRRDLLPSEDVGRDARALPPPTAAEVVALVRENVADEPIHERWLGLFLQVVLAGARPRVLRLSKRPLHVELSPSLLRSLNSPTELA
jgi:hypothetical protein